MAKHVDMILLYLDDVVFTPNQYICGSLWYARYHNLNRAFISPHKLIHDFYTCLNQTGYQAVSSDFNQDFSDLSIVKPVIGLTARTVDFQKETSKTIAEVSMKFTPLNIITSSIVDGVIYAGYNSTTAKPNNKGAVFGELIQKGCFSDISSVLFIDDSLSNIKAFEKELSSSLNIYSIHYTEIYARLLSNYEQEELDIIMEIQQSHYNLKGYYPSNDDIWGDICTINEVS